MRLASPDDILEPDDTPPVARHWRVIRAERLDSTTTILSVAGELDSAAYGSIRDALLALEGDPGHIIAIDLSAVSFMTCAGIRLVIEAQERADLGGWSLVVIAPRAPADLVLTLTGLDADLNVMRSGGPG